MGDWLTSFLFSHTRVPKPDGRSLYAYRCTESKYVELTKLVRQEIEFVVRNRPASPKLPALFCLYASETFRRQHTEGIWSWDTIFNHLGIQTPPHQKISTWVEEGVKWWGRPLIRNQSGDRRFLVTIACEGGLPLNLLRNETVISQFFRAVLEKYHARGARGEDCAEEIACEQAYLLSSSLRQDVVFRLAGKLIAKIVELQVHIIDATNPVDELNTKNPNWRKELPLRLEDETTEALLTGLVRHSSELSKTSSICMRWRGWLRETTSGWQVEKVLEVNERFSVEQTVVWIGRQQPPVPRLRVVLHTSDSSDVVALLTLQHRNDDELVYRREWLLRSGVRRTGIAVSTLHQINLSSGEVDHHIPIHNGEPWSDLPWIFIGRDGAKDWEWLTEGSASTRSEVALVLVRENFLSTAISQGRCERIAFIPTLGRVVYRVTGEAMFASPIGDSYRIRCRAEKDSDESFDLVGSTVNEVLGDRPIFRGLPSIMASNALGQRYVALGKVQWRPLYEQGVWRDSEIGCHGRVWLRLMELGSNTERFRRQIDVVPKSLCIERAISTTNRSGEYRLGNIGGASISLASKQIVEIQAGWDDVKVVCPSLHKASLEPLLLVLQWSSVEHLELALPYPQRGAVFQLIGKTLADCSSVPLGRLGGLQLLLQDQSDSSRFVLDAALEGSRLGFRQQLPALSNGFLVFALEVERDRIAFLLASTDKQDVSVKISIFCGQELLTTVHIARFDVALQPYHEKKQVGINEKSLSRLGSSWEHRIQVEMIPLGSPMAEPITLQKFEDAQDVWKVPSNLGPGPWWIIGRDNDWARFRPLLWSVRNEIADASIVQVSTPLSLKSAILESNEEKRTSQLIELMVALGQNAEHPDWPLIFDYIRLTREFPPSSLDVLKQLIAHPPALTLALLKSADDTFNQLWSLSEQMPFSWSLIQVEVWLHAARLYFESLRHTLIETKVDSAHEIVWGMFKDFRGRATGARDAWKPLCDWLQEILFPKHPFRGDGNSLRIARSMKGLFSQRLIEAEQELQGRHSADEEWPRSDEVKSMISELEPAHRYEHLRGPFRPVRCAPFVAAQLSLKGIEPSPMLVYELRLIRAFDAKWFFEVYGIALALGLAGMPQEKN